MRSPDFGSAFGSAAPTTGVSAEHLGLAHSEVIRRWTGDGDAGVYRGGLLSLCSVRENGGDLELPELLADPGVLEDHFRDELFETWRELSVEDLDRQWLRPTPAMPLGGDWTVASLKAMSTALYLSFTAQLFDDDGSNQVEIRRLP